MQNCVLIVDDEALNRGILRAVLEAAGWAVVEAADGNEAVERARETLPALIIMDIHMPGGDGITATRTIRAGARPLSSVPILVYSTTRLTDAEVAERGMDGRVPKPFTPEQLIAAVEPWQPDGQMAGAERLADLFGRDKFAQLVGGLRDQLAVAVDEMDDAGMPAVAHRIAGVAGTLGFAAVSASWLALSEGDESARDQARRDARMAIAAIDRSELVAPHH